MAKIALSDISLEDIRQIDRVSELMKNCFFRK